MLGNLKRVPLIYWCGYIFKWYLLYIDGYSSKINGFLTIIGFIICSYYLNFHKFPPPVMKEEKREMSIYGDYDPFSKNKEI